MAAVSGATGQSPVRAASKAGPAGDPGERPRVIPAGELTAFTRRVLEGLGAPARSAAAVAESLVAGRRHADDLRQLRGGMAVRPLGGVLFGHVGGGIGRRETLIITTLVMGLSTGIIGLLPTYDSIGIWAPLLPLLRVCQGLGAGAEFGGASTLLVEHAPPGRRGFFGSFAQAGVQIGLVLATVAFLIVGSLPDDQLTSWGWRIPFLLSFLMIGVTLYVRLRVEESPIFKQVQKQQRVVKLPIGDAIKRYPRSMLVGVGAHICDTAVIYTYATFSVAYLIDELDFSRTTALMGIVIAGLVVIALQPVYGGSPIASAAGR
jgi:MHS family shikimate/dehydroshikimate transporter-like MFS transporter